MWPTEAIFGLSGSDPSQTNGPIWASDKSKRVIWAEEVPLVDSNLSFSVFVENGG